MKGPFLSIVTRCCLRPKQLGLNILSIRSQTCKDVEQVFIVDREKQGIYWANCAFEKHKQRIKGEYVYIVDDDMRLIDKNFVLALRNEARLANPDIVMVRASRPQFAPNLLPNVEVWGNAQKLRLASTNPLCYVVRRDLWMKHICAFCAPAAGDWWFLDALLEVPELKVLWLDRKAATTQQLGRGRLFEDCKPNWFEEVANAHGLEELKPGDWRLRLFLNSKPTNVKPVSKTKLEIVKRPVRPKPRLVDRQKAPAPKPGPAGRPSRSKQKPKFPGTHVILSRRIKEE